MTLERNLITPSIPEVLTADDLEWERIFADLQYADVLEQIRLEVSADCADGALGAPEIWTVANTPGVPMN